MRGPMLNYRLGKMTHREYEAEASQYWGRDRGDKGQKGSIERIGRLFRRSTESLEWPGCTPTSVGPIPSRMPGC